MKKPFIVFLIVLGTVPARSQTIHDLFNNSNMKISYLGIDFSHVRLIGNFSEFLEAGEKNVSQIRDSYFQRWNRVVVNEREKYDIAGMLRKSEIFYDIDMIAEINAHASLDEMESYNAIKFSPEDIQSFVSQYDLADKEGIGVLFIAECLNKSADESIFHFVAVDMNTGKVLFNKRLRGEPHGLGLRNYWVNSINRIIRDIKYFYFNEWKMQEADYPDQVYLKTGIRIIFLHFRPQYSCRPS